MPIVDGGLCQSPEKAFNSSFSYLCILTSISLQKIQLSHVYLVYLGEDYGDIGRRVGKWEEEGKQGSMKRGKCILSCYLWYENEWNLITGILSSKEEGHIYIYILPTCLWLRTDLVGICFQGPLPSSALDWSREGLVDREHHQAKRRRFCSWKPG